MSETPTKFDAEWAQRTADAATEKVRTFWAWLCFFKHAWASGPWYREGNSDSIFVPQLQQRICTRCGANQWRRKIPGELWDHYERALPPDTTKVKRK